MRSRQVAVSTPAVEIDISCSCSKGEQHDCAHPDGEDGLLSWYIVPPQHLWAARHCVAWLG